MASRTNCQRYWLRRTVGFKVAEAMGRAKLLDVAEVAKDRFPENGNDS